MPSYKVEYTQSSKPLFPPPGAKVEEVKLLPLTVKNIHKSSGDLKVSRGVCDFNGAVIELGSELVCLSRAELDNLIEGLQEARAGR